jgi:aminoglycoside/choline kinase family phosphotransferase
LDERLAKLDTWLREVLKMSAFELSKASEDASFRQYFRLTSSDSTLIIMDAPPDKEDVATFINIAKSLSNAGLHAPNILHENIADGFLVLEDLGDTLYLDILDDESADGLYEGAIDAILVMQSKINTSGLPVFSETLLFDEMQLFSDWLLERHLKISLTAAEQNMVREAFQYLAANCLQQPQVFVHRDFHSRNLMYSNNNPGIIDFQDAVLGPLTYDLVSLLKDCYIKWPSDRIHDWLAYYLSGLNRSVENPIEFQQLNDWFNLTGVQRHLKASGIFARLSLRDGKHGFLKDIPRTLCYITDLRGNYNQLDPLINMIEEKVLPKLPEELES